MLSIPAAAVFDLDRTITRSGTYTPFLLHALPLGPRVFWNFLRGLPTLARYHAGRVSRAALKEKMLHYSIAGTPREQIETLSDAFVERWLETRIRPGARAAIARHRAAGDHLVLATASFDFYAQVFAERLGFDHLISTASVWDDSDRLCAQVDGDNCYGQAKLAAVKAYFSNLPSSARVVAYSDHHSDLDLLRWAHEGVAVNPDSKLRRISPAHNLSVVDWEAA